MPADPSTIPASAVVTNITVEPLQVLGLATFAVAEVRTVTMSTFLLPQRAVVWNALRNAVVKGLVTAPAVTFDVTEVATGQQSIINSGGQGTGGAVVDVPGGLGLPALVTIVNELADPLVIAGVHLLPGASFGYDMTLLPINQQAQVWNALIVARDLGHISSAELTTAVLEGFTGHQAADNAGGQGNGGQLQILHAT
jgi:hypothetical protein